MREALLRVANWTWSHTDSLTKWLQLIALCAAGLWAYHHFKVTERPGLENRLSVDSGLDYQLLRDSCIVSFSTTTENKGIASVDVEANVIRAWAHTLPEPRPDKLTYLDLPNIEVDCPVIFMPFGKADLINKYLSRNGQRDQDAIKRECTKKTELSPVLDNVFLGQYPPGTGRHETYDWVIRPQQQQIYLFRIDILDKAGNRLGWGQQWASDVCVPGATTTGKDGVSSENP